MNILVLIDAWFPFVGGAQVQIINLKRILEKNYGVKYFILHSPSSNILIRFLWSFWVIPQALLLNKKEKFYLIHAHAYWPGIPGIIIAKILSLPIIFTVHGSNLLDLKIKSLKAFLEKFILTKIKYDQVISVSANFLKYKNLNKNIAVISNGVNLKEFEKIRIKKEKPYKLLCVARDDPVKGLKYLKQAMIQVKKEIPQARLKIITKGITHRNLIKEYKSSHLFVLPSLSEGQPLTLLEAWAAKLPVVATAVGDNNRMVKNGFNGYLIESKNIRALSTALIKVLEDNRRSLMGLKGYLLVKKYFSWHKAALKTLKVYQAILQKN